MIVRSLVFTVLTITVTSAVGCSASGAGGPGTGSGSGPGGGGGSGSGTGGGVTTSHGWTVMPLPDDKTDPQNPYSRQNDFVADIFFESPDKGLVVTQAFPDSPESLLGGAVFRATGTAVTGVVFSQTDPLHGPDFHGLERTSTGFIATTTADDLIASSDDGATFTRTPSGNTDGSPVLALRVTPAGTTMIEVGGVSAATSAPGPNAAFTDIWAPAAEPPIGGDQAGECQASPEGAGLPQQRYGVQVSGDGRFLAYVTNANAISMTAMQPEVCISSDGGHSFIEHDLVVADASADFTPTGITFTDKLNGIVWFGVSNAAAYIQHTTDGGATWQAAAFPAAVASHDLELTAAFFAPGGSKLGWIAGFDHTDSAVFLIQTGDGGATWTNVDGVGAAVSDFDGQKIYAGFALDEKHIWLGGELGLLMHN